MKDSFELKDIKEAYLKLKNCIYYDKNYFYHNSIAEFEDKYDLNEKFLEILNILNSGYYKSKLMKYINEIDFYMLPKKMKQINSDSNENIISNAMEQIDYSIESVNYFIKMPIVLHIIDILWCIKYGGRLQKKLNLKNAYAYKLNIGSLGKIKSKNLFHKYYDQYSSWRDKAIKKTEALYDNKEDSIIFSLDIKKYYYNIDLKFDELKIYPKNKHYIRLLNIIELIHDKYKLKIKAKDVELKEYKNLLPIGLQSSGLIANWYLKDFDDYVTKELKPEYYGRYVDDILFVFKNTSNLSEESAEPIESLIRTYFSDDNMFKLKNNSFQFQIKKYSSLSIQKDKIKIFDIKANSSKTILERFKNDIKANSSEFRFLPSFKKIDDEFTTKMFNLNYDGSSNILRNIDDYKLNRYNVAVYLAKKIKLGFYVQDNENCKYDNHFVELLKKEIKGKYLIELYQYWYKIFENLILNGNAKEFIELHKEIEQTCKKIKYKNSNNRNDIFLTNRLKANLDNYLLYSATLAFSLNPDKKFKFRYHDAKLVQSVRKYRNSNIIDNNRIFIPLYNYSNKYFKNNEQAKSLNEFRNLLEFKFDDLTEEHLILNEDRLILSPICIYNSKKDLFGFYKNVLFADGRRINLHSNSIKGEIDECSCHPQNVEKVRFNILESRTMHIPKLKLGIANFSIKPEEAKNFLYRDLSDKKYEDIRALLEDAQSKKCHLVVFPEMSIPFEWLPLIYEEAKLKQIGIIAGLKHFKNNKGYCYNFLCSILPYIHGEAYRDAFVRLRLKNNYSPEEIEEIKNTNCEPPSSTQRTYDLIQWAGLYFSSYNCFEIASIEDRSIFKGSVDFITLNAYNRDTNYFNNIISSTSRDLHTCIVHSNNSENGYSCIALPKKTHSLMPVIIKGGEDNLIITYEYDYKKLRKFQSGINVNAGDNDKKDEEYKPLPPNFKISKEREIEIN